jgi:hypothetical protein
VLRFTNKLAWTCQWSRGDLVPVTVTTVAAVGSDSESDHHHHRMGVMMIWIRVRLRLRHQESLSYYDIIMIVWLWWYYCVRARTVRVTVPVVRVIWPAGGPGILSYHDTKITPRRWRSAWGHLLYPSHCRSRSPPAVTGGPSDMTRTRMVLMRRRWRRVNSFQKAFEITSGILPPWTGYCKTVLMCLNMVQTCMYMFIIPVHEFMNMYAHSLNMYMNI